MKTEQYPRRHPEASFRPMGDEGGLVVLPTQRVVKVLNPVGIKVFSLLDGDHSEAQIAEAVAEEFEVAVDQATEDVSAFLAELRQNGMLVDEARANATAEETR
jgi:hypothetical protein